MNNINESYEVHNTLNPKLWDDDVLKPEVNKKLNDIANEFINYIDIPLNVCDIEIVGSNASYNYNEQSDIDLHIIVNFEINYVKPEILQSLYNSKKNLFNDVYDVNINDIPVELYIEDVNASNATKGRYSILNNKWIRYPEKIVYDYPDVSNQLEQCVNICNDLLENGDSDGILNYLNSLYMMRKLSLEKDGECGEGNLVFKELRNMYMLDKLRDKYYELRSKELSL